jgi:hypothetical protein
MREGMCERQFCFMAVSAGCRPTELVGYAMFKKTPFLAILSPQKSQIKDNI